MKKQRYPETERTLEIIRAAYKRLENGERGALVDAAKALKWPVHRISTRGKELGLAKPRAKFTDQRANQVWNEKFERRVSQ
jgi:hypothetical protein